MKKIKLTQNQFALVDDCEYEYLNQWKWCARRNGNTFYAVRNSRKTECEKRKLILMHQVILQRMGIEFEQVDHIDGNGLNNCRSNLRAATKQENGCNRNKQKNNTSGRKGVGWNKQHQKWQAQIQVNGKQIHLGYFDDIEDAVRAYNQAAKKHFGKFARLNIIGELKTV